MTRYLTVSELIYINGKVLQDDKILSGKQQIREIERLEAAAARPSASAFGADAYPSLHEKVAVLFHSIARNHPFRDGNKRTATVALLFMVEVNGETVTWEPEAALEVILDVAEGRQDYPFLRDWLPAATGSKGILDPDTDRDAQLIDHLLETHKWLLNELAER
ncbi:MAG: type II toxin-antitoxin system death-on-curing family toxin [Chloroflexota bacterium]